MNLVLPLLWRVKVVIISQMDCFSEEPRRPLNEELTQLELHLCCGTIRSTDSIKPLLLILYWSSVAIHFLHSVCWSDQKNSFTPASVSLSVGRGHCRADVSRHWNLIMALQLNSGLPTFLYFSHLWFQQPASPGRLRNIISLMDGSAGWQEWMIALRSHLPQTVHWHK